MKTKTKPEGKTQARPVSEREEPSLDRRYGKIGIPAVAAALPYQSDAKNSAYAPVVHRDNPRLSDLLPA